MARMMSPRRKSRIEILLMPCIYFTNFECGLLGFFFFRYRYSAI
jgi:hypothetical protein